VIIGDTPHSIKYKNNLEAIANSKVKLLGAVYGDDYKVILRNAYCYVHGHEAGGTNPALLEAMASKNCVVVLDAPYNLEVIKNCGISFSKKDGDLLSKLEMLDKDGDLVNSLSRKAFRRVRDFYKWEKVISDYDTVFRKPLAGKEPRKLKRRIERKLSFPAYVLLLLATKIRLLKY
jgi:rhamnosyltransferase